MIKLIIKEYIIILNCMLFFSLKLEKLNSDNEYLKNLVNNLEGKLYEEMD
jgi:hypothetical protein